MVTTPEARLRTQEEREYWGGYFGANLRPYLIANNRRRAQDPNVVRTTYLPSLNVFDSRRQHLDLLQPHFGGTIRQNDTESGRSESTDHWAQRELGFTWKLSRIGDALRFLERVQPDLIYGYEVTQTIIDFLAIKQERMTNTPAGFNILKDMLEQRDEEDREAIGNYNLARAQLSTVRAPLTDPNIAGIADTATTIFLSREERGKIIEYFLRARISLPVTHRPLLQAVSEICGGDFVPENPGNQRNARMFLVIHGMQNLRKFLEPVSKHSKVLQEQAKLGLAFMDFQDDINGGLRKTSGRRRRGKLAETLAEYSKQDIDLVTITREGFYSEMYRLNSE